MAEVMREAPAAQNVSGGKPNQVSLPWRRAGGFWLTLAVIAMICLSAGLATAQQRDPSLALPPVPGTNKKSVFGKKTDFFGKRPKIDSALPIYITTDKLIYDDKNSRVIAQGNVE